MILRGDGTAQPGADASLSQSSLPRPSRSLAGLRASPHTNHRCACSEEEPPPVSAEKTVTPTSPNPLLEHLVPLPIKTLP